MKAVVTTRGIPAAKGALYGIKNGFPKAMTRAINKTLTGARTDAVDEISKVLNLTKTRIRKDFSKRNSTWKTLEGRFYSTGKPVGLASFAGTRQTKKGVSFKIFKRGKRSIIGGAFVAERRGANHVFLRKYRKGKKKGQAVKPNFPYGVLPRSYRLPVWRLTGPRVQDIYDDKPVMDSVLKKAGERFDKNLDYETDRLLRSV